MGLNNFPTAAEPLSAARYFSNDRLRDAWVSLGDGSTLGGLAILEYGESEAPGCT